MTRDDRPKAIILRLSILNHLKRRFLSSIYLPHGYIFMRVDALEH
jgi:hypothetical protein